MARPLRLLALAAQLSMTVLLGGCFTLGETNGYLSSWNTGAFQPYGGGPAAVVGAVAVIPGLHLAQTSTQLGTTAGFGPGTARFNGTVLEAFSTDGNLDPNALGMQPGFFLRPTSTYGGYQPGGYDLGTTGGGANDSLIAWGVWGSAVLTLGTRGNQVDFFHFPGAFYYVTGQQTPVLPQSGIARYSLFTTGHSTNSENTGPAPSAFTSLPRYLALDSQLSVLWGGATPKVGLDLKFARTQQEPDVRLQTTGGVNDPAQSQLSVRNGTATFGGTINTFATCPAGSTCSGTVEGFFAGPSAERAGLAFQILDTAANNLLVAGAAAFTFTDFIAPPAPPSMPIVLLDQTNPNAFAMAFAPSNVFAGAPAGPPATATQASDGQLTAFNFPSSPGSTVNIGRGTTQSPAAETGSDGLISWGRWTNGTTTGSGPGFGALTFSANQGFHYAVGAATPPANLPASGTATFNLLGATKPTFGDGAFAPGTFSGSMAVQWGGAAGTKVGVDFTVTMPGDASYRMVSNGGLATPGTSLISTSLATGSSFSGPANITGSGRACAPACSGNVNGFFAGPNAERAGLSYTIGFIQATTIQGAAAFTR